MATYITEGEEEATIITIAEIEGDTAHCQKDPGEEELVEEEEDLEVSGEEASIREADIMGMKRKKAVIEGSFREEAVEEELLVAIGELEEGLEEKEKKEEEEDIEEKEKKGEEDIEEDLEKEKKKEEDLEKERKKEEDLLKEVEIEEREEMIGGKEMTGKKEGREKTEEEAEEVEEEEEEEEKEEKEEEEEDILNRKMIYIR